MVVKVSVLGGLVLLILLVNFASVIAEVQEPTQISLFPKNSDWSIIEHNSDGWVRLNYASRYGNQIQARALGLKKYTFYSLVYTLANEETAGKNTEVFCVDKKKTNNIGDLKIKTTEFRNSLENISFWIVLSKDVDCRKNKMIDWNPVKYLFSEEVI